MILNNLNLDFIRIVADILDLIVAMPATAVSFFSIKTQQCPIQGYLTRYFWGKRDENGMKSREKNNQIILFTFDSD